MATPSTNRIVWALHDFDAEAPDEISFKAGDQITVMETDEQYNDNWWLGTTSSGQSGLFPSTYTTPDRAVMLASQSAFAAVIGGEASTGAGDKTQNGAQHSHTAEDNRPSALMGNTMADLDDALKQMQNNPRASYAGTDFSVQGYDNDTELGEGDDAVLRSRGGRKGDHDGDDDDDDDGEDYLASQSSAARAALALKAKSNAFSAIERERVEQEQRKAAAQRRLEEEEERQRALLLHVEGVKEHLSMDDSDSIPPQASPYTPGVQRKPTLTSKIPLTEVELSDDSESEAGDYQLPLQKRTDKGKQPEKDGRGGKDVLTPLPSWNGTGASTSFSGQETNSSGDVSISTHSILFHPPEDTGMSPAFGEVTKLHEAAAAAAAAQESELQDVPRSQSTSFPANNTPSILTTSAAETPALSASIADSASAASTRTAPNLEQTANPTPFRGDASTEQATPTRSAVALPSAVSATPSSSHASPPALAPVGDFGPGPDGDPIDWTVEQVVQWGRSKGFDEAAIVSKFQEHEITGDVLLEMDVNILKEIDINAFGKRFQVAAAIKELKKHTEEPSAGPAIFTNGWSINGDDVSPGTNSRLNPPNAAPPSMSEASSPRVPSVQEIQLHEQLGLALSTPSSEAEVANSSLASTFTESPVASSLPASFSSTTSATTKTTTSTTRPGPASRAPRVSFSQTVQTVEAPPSHSAGAYGGMPGRSRSSISSGRGRGDYTNGPSGGASDWPSHLVTIASGQGIGNVYTGSEKRNSGGATMSPIGGPQFQFSKVPTQPRNPGALNKAVSSSALNALTPGGGTIPPPLLPRRRESATDLNSLGKNGSASAESPSVGASTGGEVSPRLSERENGRAVGSGERTSFFATLTSRNRKPAPRASQHVDGADVSASSGTSAGGSSFGSRFKKQHKDRDSALSDLRNSQTGSLSPASGGPVTQGRSSFNSARGGMGSMANSSTDHAQGGSDPGGRRSDVGSTWGAEQMAAAGANGTGTAGGESVLSKIRPVDLDGWLLKKGDRYNSWKTRYVALKGPDLVVLRSAEADKIKGYISMKGYRVLADENTNPGKYGFKIVHETEKSHYFSSADPAVIRDWMKALMKSTIGRDHSFPVISSYNNKTISLREAQAMYPPPRPPSPDSRLRVQRANIRANPNSLSAKDAAILTGLIPQKSGSLGPAK
ncbi:hypothetical protein V8E36_005163 [Tilletia maclaganii]